jgi:hypothetical protein
MYGNKTWALERLRGRREKWDGTKARRVKSRFREEEQGGKRASESERGVCERER